MENDQFQDELWLRAVTHGRGLDTLPLETKAAIQHRFAGYGTAGLFPEVEPKPHPNIVSFAPNITFGYPGSNIQGSMVFVSALVPPLTVAVDITPEDS